MYHCVCCGLAVPSAEGRRNLGSPSANQVTVTLRQLVSDKYSTTVAIQLLPSDINIISESKVFACKVCFRRIEKLIKLKSDTEQLLQELSQKLKEAFKANNISMDNPEENRASGPSVGRTPTKRLLRDVEESTPKRRRRPDAAEQQALSQTAVTGSPAVSVSCGVLIVLLLLK